MSDRFGLAIVGAGLAATPHAQALAGLKEKIDVRGVFTRSQKNLAAFCAEYGFPQADNLDTLLNDPNVDAVLVLTPPDARQKFTEPESGGPGGSLMDFPCDWHKSLIEDFVEAVRDGRPPGLERPQRPERACADRRHHPLVRLGQTRAHHITRHQS